VPSISLQATALRSLHAATEIGALRRLSQWVCGGKAMSAMNTEQLVVRLRGVETDIAVLCKVKEIALLGSSARGDQGGASDIGVLVGPSLFSEKAPQQEMHVVPKHALKAGLGESALREVAPL